MYRTLVEVIEDSMTPFAQRRIDEIPSNKDIKLCYIYTDQSPADIASSGCTVKMVNLNDFWWHRPTWLQKYPQLLGNMEC